MFKIKIIQNIKKKKKQEISILNARSQAERGSLWYKPNASTPLFSLSNSREPDIKIPKKIKERKLKPKLRTFLPGS